MRQTNLVKLGKKVLEQTRHFKYVGAMLLIVLGVILAPRCNRPIPIIGAPTIESVNKSLKPDERRKIVVKANRAVDVERTKQGTKGKVAYVPPEGSVEVTVKESGEIKVYAKTKGFSFSPGVGGGLSNGSVCPVLDVKWGFWGRLGGVSGIGITRRSFVYLGLSYHIYRNTSIFVAVTHEKEPLVGIRLGF